jgi:hypothetical protein
MEVNWVAVFGFGVFFLCWIYLLVKRGKSALGYGASVLVIVVFVGGAYGIFQLVGGRLGMFAFIALLWAIVLYMFWRRCRASKVSKRDL